MDEELRNIENLSKKFEEWEPQVSREEMQQDWNVLKTRLTSPGIHPAKFHSLRHFLYPAAGVITASVVYLSIHYYMPKFKPEEKMIKKESVEVKHGSSFSGQNKGNAIDHKYNSKITIYPDKKENPKNSPVAENKNSVNSEKVNPVLPFVKQNEGGKNVKKDNLNDLLKNTANPVITGNNNSKETQPANSVVATKNFPEITFGNYLTVAKGNVNIYDTVICSDDSLQITSNLPGQLSIFLPENELPVTVQDKFHYRFLNPGEYSIELKYTEQGLELIKYQKILVISKPVARFTINSANAPEIRFINESEKSSRYHWNFGDNMLSYIENPVHKYFDTGYYNVTLIASTQGVCSDTLTNTIHVVVYPELRIPNIFTPNNDGLNDFYYITIKGDIYYELNIFNDRSMLVYSSKDKTRSWDGKYKGKNCPDGVYYYVFKYRFVGQDRIQLKTGTITILR